MGISRRSFLVTTAKAAAGTGIMLSGVAPVYSAPKAKKRLGKLDNTEKALVFIMLDGGNDSYNMLVPMNDQHYREYKETRSNLALSQNDLLPLKGFEDKQGRHFGIHNSMKEVQSLFQEKKLSFVANVGVMTEPVTKEKFYSNEVSLPLGLLSHADQFNHWQTARPDMRINRGWFGSFADSVQSQRAVGEIPMNISLAGNNVIQNGVSSSPYSVTESGSVGLIINEEESELNRLLLSSFESSLNTSYRHDPFKESYLAITRESQQQHDNYAQAINSVRIKGNFSGSPLSQQLKQVARSIKAADKLGHKKQTYFVRYIGWDHHDELLNNHKKMLKVLSRALGEFQTELEKQNIADKVITFTGSDFGRTLTSNGNGTDHGWGGNIMAMVC